MSQVQQIQILANHHEIRINPSKPVHHYVLEIQDSTPELVISTMKQLRPQLQETLSVYMSINQNIYSPKLVSKEGIPFKLKDENGGELENQVTLTYKEVITQQNPEYTLLISRLFKQVLRNQYGMVSVGARGQKLFWPNKVKEFPQQNLNIWPGVEVVFKSGKSPSVVVDCAFKVLRYRTALQELCDNKKPDSLVGEIIMTQYNRKFYKIEGVDVNKRPTDTFTNEKGETLSFVQYYKQRYNIDVPGNQPLLLAKVKGKRKEDEEKSVYLIPSSCQMTGLSDQIRNDFNAMKALAVVTKPNGNQRIESSREFAMQLSKTEIVNKKTNTKRNIFSEWGVEIQPNSMQLEAQRIHPGNMLMGANVRLDLVTANLDRQTQCQMFQMPAAQYVVFVIRNRNGERSYRALMDNLKQACQEFQFNCFVSIQERVLDRDDERELQSLAEKLHQECQQRNARIGLMIFLLPGQKKKARLYRAAKQITMNMFGCPSQVIVEKTLEKNTRSIVNKILIQLNAKIGGIPWAIDGIPQRFRAVPTMICGTDIFHKTGSKPSQLAFCSTFDQNFARYFSQVVTSGEFSSNLQEVMRNSLQAFQESNKILPQQIIVYRDGVGQGQENVVIETEIPQYKNAIQNLNIPDCKLIVIICNKRVSAKFYTAGQRADNPQPGTCVDSQKVVDQGAPNFYLISQITRQGTVTPTQYKIIFSDVQDPSMQQDVKVLTFKLCYLFYNFTGSIKTPAPVRYAHCLSNFIGDNYQSNDQLQFLPIPDLVRQKVLYYI